MRVIVAGSRTIADPEVVARAIAASGFEVTEVVSGGCRGVDALGYRWAHERGLPTRVFRAAWSTHGKAAGPIRNRQMAEYADALVAVWDGRSPGTASMIAVARSRGLKVFIERS